MENVIAVSDLRTPTACRNALARLLDMSDEDLASQDIALVNLVCARLTIWGISKAKELPEV